VRLRLHTRYLAIIVVAAATLLAWFSSRGDSPIVDEVPHIGAGYSYVKQWDMRLNPEHPPLVKDLAGLPLLTLDIDQHIFNASPWTNDVNGQWNFGRAMIFTRNANADLIKDLARAPVFLFFFISCWLVWKWMRERYGAHGALIAVILVAFSPTILAHSRLVTTDMAATTGVLAATYFFLKLLRTPSKKHFVLSTLTLGLAFLAKFNTILLGPYFVLIALLLTLDGHPCSQRRWKKTGRALLLTAGVGFGAVLCVVWPVYVLHTWDYPVDRQSSDTQTILASQDDDKILKKIALWASDTPVIRALGHWTLGLAMVQQRNSGGNTIYWLGQVVRQGGPWYFPIVYFLKEPLAWWLLSGMAIASLAMHRQRHRGSPKHGSWWMRHTEEWVWLLWLAFYWTISIRSTLNIGIRHLLPIYPFAIMLVAGRLTILIDWLRAHDPRRLQWFGAIIALLLGWYVFETVHVHPYYLTYFNQIAGGPSGGYRYVVDSNLDWGQDAKRLAQWVHEHAVNRICVDYFGWSDVSWYMPREYRWTSSSQWRDATDFKAHNQCDGWIAVSATFLQNANGERTFARESTEGTYRWLLEYQPVTVIGNSIFVYHITQ
jgi:dolichyl-phosphate-mannose-protein mannosyltransferase